MSESPDDFRSRIRTILLAEWDPSGAERSEAAHHTYDAYLGPLADLIRSGAGEEAIVAFLKERESEIMCFPAIGTSHLKRVARKLAGLVTSPDAPPREQIPQARKIQR